MIIEAKGTVLNFGGELQKPFYKNRSGTWFLHHRRVNSEKVLWGRTLARQARRWQIGNLTHLDYATSNGFQPNVNLLLLQENLKRRKVKSEVIKLFQSAARVYMRKGFDLYMSDIAKVDKKTYDYLMEEPPKMWARSCSPRQRYDMLTTNIVESMNSVLLEARELPILRMMTFIQVKLQRWFYERRNEAEGNFYNVSCWVEEDLKKKIDLALTLNVFPVDSWHSRVEEEGITFLVDLNKRTCDCFQFQFDELPCIHAIAAIAKRNIKKSNFCSHWYLKESWLKTYERQIHPVGQTDFWIVPESVKSQIIKHPDYKVPPGRRQKKRHIPATE
uniref:Uncharacterized protein LOC104213190 n=1 Tax=Nicotiana sylvestris TaxID=4096 RepID=A0A1U7VF43_NICSY|nr:PREDICTED: uncharacterized protein LOC104213190 [Nicotiana sylvestris]